MVTCTKRYVSNTKCTVTFSKPENPLHTNSKNYQIQYSNSNAREVTQKKNFSSLSFQYFSLRILLPILNFLKILKISTNFENFNKF